MATSKATEEKSEELRNLEGIRDRLKSQLESRPDNRTTQETKRVHLQQVEAEIKRLTKS